LGLLTGERRRGMVTRADDAFPTTVTGKIQKFEIRKMMIDELGVAEAKTA
jgi:hypothetical protein